MPKTSICAARIAAGIAGVMLAAPVAPAASECFGPDAAKKAAFSVIAQAPPPGLAGYAHYPASAAATQNIARLNASTAAEFGKYWFVWANRCTGGGAGINRACNGNQKGNVIEPAFLGKDETPQRAFFSTLKAADSCTLAQVAHAVGAADVEVKAMAQAGRIKIVTDRPALAAQLAGARLEDVCMLPVGRLSRSVTAVLLDYEVADGRTPAHSKAFLIEIAHIVKRSGRASILYTNALDAPSQRLTGIGPDNLRELAEHFDQVTMLLAHQNRSRDVAQSAREQLELLRKAGAPTRKILPVFDLGDTTLVDAKFVHDMMLRERFPALMIWRNKAHPGGACETTASKRINCVVFGVC